VGVLSNVQPKIERSSASPAARRASEAEQVQVLLHGYRDAGRQRLGHVADHEQVPTEH
jgi:hypothetical protein